MFVDRRMCCSKTPVQFFTISLPHEHSPSLHCLKIISRENVCTAEAEIARTVNVILVLEVVGVV